MLYDIFFGFVNVFFNWYKSDCNLFVKLRKFSDFKESINNIYTGKTKWCLPKFQIHRTFQVANTENYWYNQIKAVEHIEKVIFPYLQKIKAQNFCLREQVSLIIIDSFKCQDNIELKDLYAKNSCANVIGPHSLTNKLDVSVYQSKKVLYFRKLKSLHGRLNFEEVENRKKLLICKCLCNSRELSGCIQTRF